MPKADNEKVHLVFIQFIFSCKVTTSTSRIEENSSLLKFPEDVSGEKSSSISIYKLEWLTGQREGSHDGRIKYEFNPRTNKYKLII